MSVPHVLLRLLLEGQTHGYDLRRKLGAFSAFYPLSNVNVYPALKDLEEQGWVYLADVPVILNTVLGESDERGAALDAGANGYVCKSREDAGRQLVNAVDELLGKAGNPAS